MSDAVRPLRILHLEDNPRDAALIQDRLEQGGITAAIELVADRGRFEQALEAKEWDLILCDYNLPGYDGLSALRRALETRPLTPVIMLSGSISPEEAVACMRDGATDYLLKQRSERLASAVARAIHEVDEHRLRMAAEALLREKEAATLASLREKEALLKEVHHRVKNNLQVIASLLNLEARRISEPEARRALAGMTGRIHSMALLHEMLYRSQNFDDVRLDTYLHRIVNSVLRAASASSVGVTVGLEGDPVSVTIDQATPCGLIVHELASNCLRHGLAEGASMVITLAVRQGPDDGEICVRVSDNGVGLPKDFDERRRSSLGLQLVADLARQLGGRLEIGSGTAGPSLGVLFLKTPEGGAART